MHGQACCLSCALFINPPSLHEKKCDIMRLCYLNKTFNDGNQIAMWVKKDKGENVKVEFQFADGSSVTTSLQWVSPEDGWTYMVFDLWNLGDEHQAKTLKMMYIQLHTGGKDGQIATIGVTGIVMGFDLNNPPAPVPTKDIAKPSIFKVEGQGNLVTMISELTIGNEDFTQYESPKVSAQFYLFDESGEEIAFGEEFNADIFSGSLTYSVAPTVTESVMKAGTYYAKVVWVFPFGGNDQVTETLMSQESITITEEELPGSDPEFVATIDASSETPEQISLASYITVANEDEVGAIDLSAATCVFQYAVVDGAVDDDTVWSVYGDGEVDAGYASITGRIDAGTYVFRTVWDFVGNQIFSVASEPVTVEENQPTAVMETEDLVVLSAAGRIYAEGEFAIVNLIGQDVTADNGNLRGVYIVIAGDKYVKINVK